MTTANDVFSGGFKSPVFDSGSVFRILMDGMSRPGSIRTVSAVAGQPAPMGDAAGAVALALCDHETPVWLGGGLRSSPVGKWLAFHTGAPLTPEKAEAQFAFIEAGAALTSFNLFSPGSQEYPDRSTTVVIEVSSFTDGPELTLTGPGIARAATVRVAGLPAMFLRLWSDNRVLFPRGVDVVLTAGSELLCLPRTTGIAVR